jgi:sulfatase modifying factor 1
MKTLRILTSLLSIGSAAVMGVESSSPVTPTQVVAGDEGSMADIPAGSYVPLYTTDKTPRKVSAFRIDKISVTKRQYLTFVQKHPRWLRSKTPRLFADASYLKDWKSDADPGTDLDSPVTNISWFAARAYAKHLGKRLPTVDEWEYIARADATKVDATSDDAYTQVILKWYSARPTTALASPKKFTPNIYGVRALHGLIWEWNEDFNNAMVTGESRGDSGIERNLFCAGGALTSTDVNNYAAFMRYAFRASLKGNYTTASLGFRCAADTPTQTPETK